MSGRPLYADSPDLCAVCGKRVPAYFQIAAAVYDDREVPHYLCRECGRLHAKAGTIALMRAAAARLGSLGFDVSLRIDDEVIH